MSTVTAKAFRQQIMKPAEGLFLFHARAIERLIMGQFGDRLTGVTIPALPYYLMPRGDFLFGLETENPEALSVIEGLRLPEQVILLPSPPEQRLAPLGFSRLRGDYWARAFEAEVARAWHSARTERGDLAEFGANGLRRLIGTHAFAEVRAVLEYDGIILPIWEDDLICRSFVALVVRLRYFAPGARGFFFPAVMAWPRIDRWLIASGLDLPEPLADERLPALLVRSRPGGGDGQPAPPPLLPVTLPYGRSDPDLRRRIAPPIPHPWRRLSAAPGRDAAPILRPGKQQHPGGAAAAALQGADRGLDPAAQPAPDVIPNVAPDATSDATSDAASDQASGHSAAQADLLTAACLTALQQASRLQRRPGPLRRLGRGVLLARDRLLATLPLLPGGAALADYLHVRLDHPRQTVDIALFAAAISRAQRAEFAGRFARALRWLALARQRATRIEPTWTRLPAALEQALAVREAAVEAHLSDQLAARWPLPPALAADQHDLVHRLAAESRSPAGAPSATSLLACLELVLREGYHDYYRLQPGRWLRRLGRARLREILPFQPLLKSLRALHVGRVRLEELPWPIGDLERFSAVLAALDQRVGARLDTQLRPRLERAMREADFLPRNHREIVAAQKMELELLDVIRHRRHLKFTDVRDIVARNILRLPDPTVQEFFHGDRLRRFDRTATRALPGVYRPGEVYIRGLQQVSAPLFGTPSGRTLMRRVLLPFGGAWVTLKTLDMVLAMNPFGPPDFHLASFTSIAFIGAVMNLFLYSDIGRHILLGLWSGGHILWHFLRHEAPYHLLRWGPLASFLNTGLARGLGRNLIAPTLIGLLPLTPIIGLAVLVEEIPMRPGLWLFGLAFALGTLMRNTPGGRRFLDNLASGSMAWLRRFNQLLVIGTIQQLLYFFKEVTRRFAQVLNQVGEALTHHLGERWYSLIAKALLTPLWRLAEALINFYVTVLVEPQANPVKHFPIVSIGHKILLPFLPTITTTMVGMTKAFLPAVLAYPLVTLTILLLPGLFGFLVWELKENWKLYEANHPQNLRGLEDDSSLVEPAVVGHHGETMRRLLQRGFHSGTLPKGFDRLRRVIRDQLRNDSPASRRLRRCQRNLEDLGHALDVFGERELVFALRERGHDPSTGIQHIESRPPRLATNLAEFQLRLLPRVRMLDRIACHSRGGAAARRCRPRPTPIRLRIRIWLEGKRVHFETALSGDVAQLGARCWALISDDLRLFAARTGADPRGLQIALPASARPLALPAGDPRRAPGIRRTAPVPVAATPARLAIGAGLLNTP